MDQGSTTQFVVFGDSLSDDGNLFAAGEGVIPDELADEFAGFEGRVSNGPTFVEYLDEAFGFDESENYAVAAGEVLGTQTIGDLIVENDAQDLVTVPPDDPRLDFDINIDAQIDRWEADTAGQDISNTTVFYLAGGNDYQNVSGNIITFPINALIAVNNVVDGILQDAEDLLDMGVEQVVISSLPSAEFLPLIADQGLLSDFADFIVDEHNTELRDGVAELQNNGADVLFLDLSIITDAILEDGGMFGFLAPQQLTLQTGDPAALAEFTEDQVAFWDPIHPSAATHAVFAQFTEAYFTRQVVELGRAADNQTFGDEGFMIFGYSDDDALTTGGGDDLIFGGTGDDTLNGGAGDDILAGGSGEDSLIGGAGSDIIADGWGDDVTDAGDGDDIVIDGLGNDVHSGGAGDDVFVFFDEGLIGGDAILSPPSNSFDGGTGNDTFIAVVSEALAAELQGAQTIQEYLDPLGIVATNVESFELYVGLEEFEAQYGAEQVYVTVDQWGFV
ncbi:MAG: SGNH/GDSL hydrolase family protein [Pseudomonadota bacterium]